MRYCKSTIFQANHNPICSRIFTRQVVCDTAKVRFFKQITTALLALVSGVRCLRYCKSTIFQANHNFRIHLQELLKVVCDTAKVRFFKQITTFTLTYSNVFVLFAILQKYDFSSKSQRIAYPAVSFSVVCDTAKVRFFKQITTVLSIAAVQVQLFAILQKYDFSSKSQHNAQYIGRLWMGKIGQLLLTTIF